MAVALLCFGFVKIAKAMVPLPENCILAGLYNAIAQNGPDDIEAFISNMDMDELPGGWCASEQYSENYGRYCYAAVYDGQGNGISITPSRVAPNEPLLVLNGLWMSSPDGIPLTFIEADGETFRTDRNRNPELFESDGLSFVGWLPRHDEDRILAGIWRSETIRFSTNDKIAEISTYGLAEAVTHCALYMNGQ